MRFALLWAWAAAAQAAPFDLTYQGRVLDAAGAPVSGPHELTVTLYPTGAPPRSWTFPDLELASGSFAVTLDGADSEWFSGDVEVGLALDGGAELSPRSPLASVPRAHVARAIQVDPTGTAVACAAEGQLVWDRATRRVKVCDGALWLPVSGPRTILAIDGVRRWSDGSAAASCEAYRRPASGDETYAGDTGDGVYAIDPDGTGPIAAVPLYCDMTSDGGGWTMIAKAHSGSYTSLTNAQYLARIANPIEHVAPEQLQSAALPSAGVLSFLDRPFTNALHAASTVRVVRVDFDDTSNNANDGRYYQRRVGAGPTFNLWHAMRDSRLWGDGGNNSTGMVNGFGTTFKLNQGAVWNETTRDFAHGGDGSFGFWDDASVTLNTGETLSIARHMGLLCDGVGNRGDQWMLTSNPGDTRFRNDTANRRMAVWFR